MREDTWTRTEADAGVFDREYNAGSGFDNRPTLAEAEADAAGDRSWRLAEEARKTAARERGEYVPSDRTATTASILCLTLVQQGVTRFDLQIVRDGVFRLDGLSGRDRLVLDDPAFGKYEIVDRDGVVWVRGEWTDPGPPF